MSARGLPPLSPQILDEASTWFIEFRAGSLTGGARDEFMQWLRRSPDHIRAYLEISETYVRLPTSDAVPPSETERLIAHVGSRLTGGIVPFNDRVALPPPGPTNPVRPRPWRAWAVAASALLLVGGAVGAYLWTQRGLYTTGAGEERTVTLVDASRIELNARTRLRVIYSTHEREIQLLEGQALFRVAKDSARPFVVHSGVATVRAVGTQFDVYRKDSGTTVTVLEGRVAVYSTARADQTTDGSEPANTGSNAASPHPLPTALPRDSHPGSGSPGLSTATASPDSASNSSPFDPAGSAAIFLSAGEQLTVSRGGAVAQVPHAANVSAVTAWTRGQLEFQETALAEVADEFSRLSPRRLVIEDEELRDFKISGVYSSVDPASLILFLRNQPDLEVTESGDEIQVRAKR